MALPYSCLDFFTAQSTAGLLPRQAEPLPDRPTVTVVDPDVQLQETVGRLAALAGWRMEAFSSARPFLARPRPASPSCLVLEVALPDIDGLDIQRQLADQPEIPIIFVTACTNIQAAVCAMKAGAVEFLMKPFNNDELMDHLHSALDRSRTAGRLGVEMRALRRRHASLTPREREVMTLVVSGLLNKQIGGELGISEITVKAHRGQVMRKMQADSLADLVKMSTRLRPEAAELYCVGGAGSGEVLRLLNRQPPDVFTSRSS